MKLSNKIAIAAVAFIMLCTLIVLVKLRFDVNDYQRDLTVGNRSWVQMEVPLTEFTILEAGKHFEVNWHKGSPKATVRVEDNLKQFVMVKQEGQRVTIKMDSIKSYQINEAIIVDVYSNTLGEIFLNEFVQFTMKDSIHAEQIKILTENHAEANMLLNVSQADIQLNDFSSMHIKGSADYINLRLDDHSELNAKNFIINRCDLEMGDFSQARVNVLQKLKANCSDHTSLTYTGYAQLETNIINREFSEVEVAE